MFPETSKLETPTKKRFVLLQEELKFAEFLGGGAGQTEKHKRLDQLQLALEDLKVKSFFDFSSRTEAIRGVRRWSWTNRKAETTRNKHSLFPETSKLETPTKKRL